MRASGNPAAPRALSSGFPDAVALIFKTSQLETEDRLNLTQPRHASQAPQGRESNAIEDCGGGWGLESICGGLKEWLGMTEQERKDCDSDLLDWAFDMSEMTVAKAHAFLNGPSPEEITAILQRYGKS